MSTPTVLDAALTDALTLGDYVVQKCCDENEPVSNLQLQKILYFLQVVYCRHNNGNRLLFDERLYAWPYGPVVPEVYQRYAGYGGRVITRPARKVDGGFLGNSKGFVDSGIERLRGMSAWDLVSLSHAKGSPWDQTYNNGRGYKRPIPTELIVQSAIAGSGR